MSEPKPTTQIGESDLNLPKIEVEPFPFLSPPQSVGELGRLGEYRVLRMLGRGGMGVVFEAEEQALRRRVALKVLLPELARDRDYRERFLREARSAAAIHSDHVVTIFFVSGGELPYLAMQLLEGESLYSRLNREPPLTLRDALEIARQTALGLAAAHDQGLVHRDIKPANLWLESPRMPDRAALTDAEIAAYQRAIGRVKILDFGVVRTANTETQITVTGLVMGTPSYMSPEQAGGEQLDGRSDLFSLGCVLFEMLVGTLPFPGKSAMAIMSALATKTPPRVDELNRAIPTEVADLVSQLLRKNRERRPVSASEVAVILGSLLAREFEDIQLPRSSAAVSTENFFVGETEAPGSPSTPFVGAGKSTMQAPQPRHTRRGFLVGGVVLIAAVGLAAAYFSGGGPQPGPQPALPPIAVGILHSETGTMAVSEVPLIEASMLAIDEVNAAGGVLGRQLRPIIVDGKSDPAEFQKAAERLITVDRVSVIFGGMTSPSRKAMKQIVERENCLLFFPASYEGLEQSPRIIYTGAAPNQKLLPAIDYMVKTLGKNRFFILGSNLVSPRAATEVIRDHLKVQELGAEVVDTRFIPFGSSEVADAVDAIVKAKPDAIINILNGSSNFPFYAELRRRGIQSETVPTLSISLSEHDLTGLDPKLIAGDYLAGNYFQDIDRAESHVFLAKVKERFGSQRIVTDNMTAAYFGVHLWALAAKKAGTLEAPEVMKAMRGLTFEAPGGRVQIDAENQHAWRLWRVGRIDKDGTVDVVAQATDSIRADPFPATRTRKEWDRLLTGLNLEWGGRWQAPDTK